MIAAMNLLGVDAACLGNHEFDFTAEILSERIKERLMASYFFAYFPS
jgi:2',3'-cyclic-nucleotide 2'-phosphodiesterase (5'-nucleotidase family)